MARGKKMENLDAQIEIAYSDYTSSLEELGFLVFWESTNSAIAEQKKICHMRRTLWEDLMGSVSKQA
jgi:hypothetical protein